MVTDFVMHFVCHRRVIYNQFDYFYLTGVLCTYSLWTLGVSEGNVEKTRTTDNGIKVSLVSPTLQTVLKSRKVIIETEVDPLFEFLLYLYRQLFSTPKRVFGTMKKLESWVVLLRDSARVEGLGVELKRV